MTANYAIDVQLHRSFVAAAAVPALQHSSSEAPARVGVVPKLHLVFAVLPMICCMQLCTAAT